MADPMTPEERRDYLRANARRWLEDQMNRLAQSWADWPTELKTRVQGTIRSQYDQMIANIERNTTDRI